MQKRGERRARRGERDKAMQGPEDQKRGERASVEERGVRYEVRK